MQDLGIFPFGEKVKPVVQEDRTPKDVFILGVYASAVHARWKSKENKVVVNALAVASEPEIFWRGENAEEITSIIEIPDELGHLEPAVYNFNGPSGRSLDEEYLFPLGLSRKDVWLSDIYPFAHMNKGQKKAIAREYLPLLSKYDLPKPSLLPAPQKEPGTDRRVDIWQEIIFSGAKIVILLGDKPISWFIQFLVPEFGRLSDFGTDSTSYGQLHPVTIQDRNLMILPLVHPRQASRLGASTIRWFELHQNWKSQFAQAIL